MEHCESVYFSVCCPFDMVCIFTGQGTLPTGSVLVTAACVARPIAAPCRMPSWRPCHPPPQMANARPGSGIAHHHGPLAPHELCPSPVRAATRSSQPPMHQGAGMHHSVNVFSKTPARYTVENWLAVRVLCSQATSYGTAGRQPTMPGISALAMAPNCTLMASNTCSLVSTTCVQRPQHLRPYHPHTAALYLASSHHPVCSTTGTVRRALACWT